MVDIYNEVSYIKNIIKYGLSPRWQRDVKLLARYFKQYEGLKRSQTKAKILEYCQHANDNKVIYFSRIQHYKVINGILDKVYSKQETLRQIEYIDISREVLDWFLSLEHTVFLTQDQRDLLKSRRPTICMKKVVDSNTGEIKYQALNFNRVKYLFTLYMWTRIQENYLNDEGSRPEVHYLRQYSKRFKKDANLPSGFNLVKESNYMYDMSKLLGYNTININFSQGIKPLFLDYDVFKIPITDKNRVRLMTEEAISIEDGQIVEPNGDLYNPGYWLEKQKFGTFICQGCGKEFAYESNTAGAHKRIYCKECALTITKHQQNKQGKTGLATSEIRYCEDCGQPIYTIIEGNDFKTCRCVDCQEKRNRESWRESKRRIRAQQKLNNSTSQEEQLYIDNSLLETNK